MLSLLLPQHVVEEYQFLYDVVKGLRQPEYFDTQALRAVPLNDLQEHFHVFY